ncbi:hypothetical protein HPP92_012510 [Vanilla planifolia]|nr:hypothetical protein HPP92_012510 [Vanilla planifolia]
MESGRRDEEDEDEEGLVKLLLSSPSSSSSTHNFLSSPIYCFAGKSSDFSSISTTTMTIRSKAPKQEEGEEINGGMSCGNGITKRAKKDGADQKAAYRVRKERLGERIATLQQLVSPFGKSDTASVLHEALGYIRFLHDQVQVLSSPYLKRLPSSGPSQEGLGDLQSRGLCLVPLSCTLLVDHANGADLWATSNFDFASPPEP